MVALTCLGSATSLARLSLWLQPGSRAAPCTMCMTAWWSGRVIWWKTRMGNGEKRQRYFSCTARAWRKPPKDFPHGKGLSRSFESWGAWTQNWDAGLEVSLSGALNSSLLLQAQGFPGLTDHWTGKGIKWHMLLMFLKIKMWEIYEKFLRKGAEGRSKGRNM